MPIERPPQATDVRCFRSGRSLVRWLFGSPTRFEQIHEIARLRRPSSPGLTQLRHHAQDDRHRLHARLVHRPRCRLAAHVQRAAASASRLAPDKSFAISPPRFGRSIETRKFRSHLGGRAPCGQHGFLSENCDFRFRR